MMIKLVFLIISIFLCLHFKQNLLFNRLHAHVRAQLCLTLCDPMNCILPGSSLHGISQARKLEWVAISSSRGSSRPRDRPQLSCGSFCVRQILYHWATWDTHLTDLLFSHSAMSDSLWPHELEHAKFPCPPSSRVCSNLCPLSLWCHPTISSSVIPFSSCLQSFPALRSFLMSWLFISGGQNIGASVSASVLPMNIQDWFPLELTCLISLPSKGLSTVFSNTTFQKHQFFGAQPSLQSNSHIHTWRLEKP